MNDLQSLGVREGAVLKGGVRNGRSQTEMVRLVWRGSVGFEGSNES